MYHDPLLEEVTRLMEASPLLASVEQYKTRSTGSLLFGENTRLLKEQEIQTLRQNSCSAEDWSQLRVTEAFDTRFLWGTHFIGSVVLGRFGDPVQVDGGITMPSGVYKSVVAHAEIGDGALVHQVAMLSHVLVEAGAVVFSCGTVSALPDTTFGNGHPTGLSLEGGGRSVRCFAEITLSVAAQMATRRADPMLLKAYNEQIDAYLARISFGKGIIGEGARVMHTARILNAFIGHGACIDTATTVRHATVLSTPEEPVTIRDGAVVEDCVIQWGSTVSRHALLSKSVLAEYATVERHAKVDGSFIGPNSVIAEGEVSKSLVGPFVAFHHQALLIAAHWPEGKGNISHGANVGSNHTGRAPDQEIWCGEGTFFGLGVNIKMPFDFSKAPYSLIATATDTLPQKVTMPFSLMIPSSAFEPALNPSLNEIRPGWMLSDNLYGLFRSEQKFIARNKARRSTFPLPLFRPDIIDLMIEARKVLSAAEGQRLYTEKDIPGLGMNYLTEENRQKAVATYARFISFYALRALTHQLTQHPQTSLHQPSPDTPWEHARHILVTSFEDSEIKNLLALLPPMLDEMAGEIERSKTKDDVKGQKVIPDYADVHPPARLDPVVLQSKKSLEDLKQQARTLLAQFESMG